MAGIDSHLNDLLTQAPELGQSPGLTVGLAQGLTSSAAPVDSGAVGQSAALALAGQGMQQAQQDAQAHHSSGWFDSIGSFFGHAAHDVHNDVIKPLHRDVVNPALQVLSYPLGEVQHTYRYVHDVWERHGALAALKELVQIGSPNGAVDVGAMVGGDITSNITHKAPTNGPLGYQDSWNNTRNGEAYRDKQGFHVSPGRDLARLVGYVAPGVDVTHDANGNVNQEWAKLTSGVGDATFDITMDPTLKLGGAVKAARAAKYAPKLAAGWDAFDGGEELARRPLVESAGIKPNDIQVKYRTMPAVKDAFDRIGRMDTSEVIKQYPALRPLARSLGQAENGQQVADVFEQGLTARNYSFAHYGVPHTSLTRRLLGGVGIDAPTKSGLATALQTGLTSGPDSNPLKRLIAFSRYQTDAEGNIKYFTVDGEPTKIPLASPAGIGHVVNMFTAYQPFAFNSKTLALSGTHGDPNDPEFIKALYSSLRYSQNAATSNAIAAHFANADSLGEKINIVKNAYRDTIRAAGIPDESPYAQQVLGELDFHLKQAASGHYGVDRFGKDIRMLDGNGSPMARGVWANQVGHIPFLNYNELRKATSSQHVLSRVAFGADDFLNRWFTQRVFKPLVLMSLGFAERVSAGELIPASLTGEGRKVVGSGLMAASVKMHPDLAGLLDEGVPRDGLIGARAITPGLKHIGVIRDIGDGEAKLFAGGEEHSVPLARLSVLHQDITDEEMRSAADDLGINVTSNEVSHIRAAAGKALYGVSRGLVDKDYREVALMNTIANGSHMVADGLASTADMPRAVQGINKATRQAALSAGINLPRKQGLGRAFQLWDSGNNKHPLFWKYALDEASADGGGRAAARAYHEAVQGGADEVNATQAAIKADRAWMESPDPQAAKLRDDMAYYSTDPSKYSAVRVEAMKGLVYGENGELNHDVIGAFANGESPSIADLAEKDNLARPRFVKGRELEPIPEYGTLDKVIETGWKPIHAIINSLSRAPIWTSLVTDEYKGFKPWVDGGLMTKAEAHSISQTRALNRMLPLIHNTLLRNKFSLAARNVFPFYFAQEQAYKRYGRALLSNPTAFRKMQLLGHSLHSSGALQTDPSTGQEYFVFPGVGHVPFLTSVALGNLGITPQGGIPTTVTGNTISLRSVYPEAVGPGVGPVMAVPLKAIADKFHPADPYIRAFLGTFGGQAAASADITDELIPNATLRRLYEATPMAEKRRAFASTYANSAAFAMHRAMPLWAQAEKADPRAMDMSIPRDQLNPEARQLLAKADAIFALPNADASAKQTSEDRIKNATRVTLTFKALFGFLSPLAPNVEVGDVHLHAELRDMMAKYGMVDGLHRFTAKHPDATPDEVFLSANDTGVSPPATKAALDWINANAGFVAHNHLASAYLLPQGPGKYSPDAYNEELMLKLRSIRTPDEFNNALYQAQGNSEFITSLKSYEAQKAAAQAAGNTDLVSQLSQAWQSYFTNLQNRNPVWYNETFATDKLTNAQQAYGQLRQVLASGKAPDSPMVPIAQQLISDYQAYQRNLAVAQSGSGQFTKTQVTDAWKAYLDSYVAQNPEAQSLVYGVFRRLGSSG